MGMSLKRSKMDWEDGLPISRACSGGPTLHTLTALTALAGILFIRVGVGTALKNRVALRYIWKHPFTEPGSSVPSLLFNSPGTDSSHRAFAATVAGTLFFQSWASG